MSGDPWDRDAIKEELVDTKRGAAIMTQFGCGCVLYKIPATKELAIMPCALDCPLYLHTMEASRERGNAIQYRTDL